MNENPMESESTAMVEAESEPSYLDFEPYCAWHREEECDILAVHLHGFQKEQMKLQLNEHRVLTIQGQRPFVGDDMWARFMKRIEIPEGCDEHRIHAKFSGGVLAITMPRKVGHLQQEHEEAIKPIIDNSEHKPNLIYVVKDLGLWKVAAVVIALAFSGAFLHGVCKRRSYHAEK